MCRIVQGMWGDSAFKLLGNAGNIRSRNKLMLALRRNVLAYRYGVPFMRNFAHQRAGVSQCMHLGVWQSATALFMSSNSTPNHPDHGMQEREAGSTLIKYDEINKFVLFFYVSLLKKSANFFMT